MAGDERELSQDALRSVAHGRHIVDEMVDSPFFRANLSLTFPAYAAAELETGAELGEGSFCTVREIKNISLKADTPQPDHGRDTENGNHNGENGDQNGANGTLDPAAPNAGGGGGGGPNNPQDQHDEHYAMSPSETRTFMADHCVRRGDARYAIKKLKPYLTESECISGMIDLAVECRFLSTMRHPNIIKMRGTATGDLIRPGFFLVLDRLYDTLDERIDKWLERQKNNKGCLPCMGGNKEEANMLLLDRLMVAYDIASVFRYMHSHKLIYRDIKTDNIGFDVRDDVKVFDFGLTKELSESDLTDDGLYKMSGLTGSRRYMAPEVVLCQPYNLSADAFSFGILLWQIMALETPFEFFSLEEHEEKVVHNGYRPAISSEWPVQVRTLVSECWTENLKKRPSFAEAAAVLKGYLTGHAFDGENQSIDNRTGHMLERSQHSQRGM